MEHLFPRTRRVRSNVEDLLAELAVTTAIDEIDTADPTELEEFLELADHVITGLQPAQARHAA
ncbi:hypothetical protein [Saccharopolyspora griseoalba]|uniref:Uncharacterized protein n=1 Tax=Saccharopolyspora griseoalba TaxID=1431848 RepID=A0ABW2LRW7_9PSEU